MGAIYVGKKIGPGGFEKEVVLKQLLPEFTSRPEFRDLFFREAKISATLDHQNIVRTFDLVNSNERLFIVMEYVRGADLRTIAWRARRRKPLSPKAIIHVGLEILAGLGYAHSRRSSTGEPLGIIHRDLSPSNILCSGEGEVKLSDFGIAKAVTYSSVFYRVRGKVGYMSPEMAHNQPIDARSDLFSLGVSLYETLIGERIYSGDLNTPPEKIYAQIVPRLENKSPGLPKELQNVLDHALAIDPDERFLSAEAFAMALRQVASANGLLYSAPELAAELREIMGANPDNWLSDQRDSAHARNLRPGQIPGVGNPGDSLVEPGSSIENTGEEEELENVATPAARPSRSLPAAGARLSAQLPSAGEPPAESLPRPTGRTSEQIPVLGSRPSAPAATDQPQWPRQMRATPSPAPAPPASANRPPAPAEPAPKPHGGFHFPAAYLWRPMGGVAALRRSRRGLWLLALVLLAALLGFGFVRFFLRPASPEKGTSPAVPVGVLDDACPSCSSSTMRLSPWKA
jgi:eukaryotic-like serine/threonine-protein kinase